MKFRWRSKLLHLKQTMLFVVFGIIISYVSFLSSTILGGIKILNEFQEGVEKFLKDSPMEKDWLYYSFIQSPDVGDMFMKKVRGFLPEQENKDFQYHIFMKNRSNDEWTILSSSYSYTRESFAFDLHLQNDLNKTLETGLKIDKAHFFGQEKTRKILIDITGINDSYDYVIELMIRQGGIIRVLKEDRDQLLVYSIMILILSTVIGSFFASRLSKPINIMTDMAIQLASGNLEVEYKKHSACNRLDDLGVLAQSIETMADNIRHRIASMQTMNRIDRAVLSSVSRKELMYKVSGYISQQFGNTEVVVLERIEGGYHILAAAPKVKESKNRILWDKDLPEKIRVNAEELLEINKQDFLSGRITCTIIKLKNKIFSIPLFQDELFVGILIITVDSLSDQDRETLRMLSDQAGVALKSLHDMKQKDILYKALLQSLTRSVDAKSRWTAGHSDRVAEVADILAVEMNLDEKLKDAIHMGGLLHDIGKMGVPEAILDKPGRLTDKEFTIIKSHPAKGYEILRDIPDFDVVRQITRSHHERWDGSGYPDGLKGEEIPLPARIVTIADVFDAITENRPYRKGFTIDETLKFLTEQRGKIFDPTLLDLFLEKIIKT
ncbi:MAG: hypothetical protein B6241_07545 [Spirochaetaceae bacterium 4572_59]|nr:MAG: hypothetical protein B6241_07545 [Spirochaetaceae bacterium 4572_59]